MKLCNGLNKVCVHYMAWVQDLPQGDDRTQNKRKGHYCLPFQQGSQIHTPSDVAGSLATASLLKNILPGDAALSSQKTFTEDSLWNRLLLVEFHDPGIFLMQVARAKWIGFYIWKVHFVV